MTINNLDLHIIMNDIYMFHIYILIIHYTMQLYNIRVWLASRLRAEPVSPACEMDDPSSVSHRAAPSRARLVSSPNRSGLLRDSRGVVAGAVG
jgi:hypothetical protein